MTKRVKPTGIWRHSNRYLLLKRYSDKCVRNSYRRCKIDGGVPSTEDAQIIIAANHSNTLMDAMVILMSHRGPVVFGARADVFNNHTVAKIMNFLKIVPMVRKRDGIRQVIRNLETNDQVVDVLINKVPFAMFPEGTHRTKHSLLPIGKGVFRIAINAANTNPQKDVLVVPTGIDYEDYFHYRKNMRISYGEPINVSEFLRQNPDMLDAEVYRNLCEILKNRLSHLITYLPDDENYNAEWAKIEAPRKARREKTKTLRYILAVLLLPLFLACAILTLPMWAAAEFLCYFVIKDKAFRNSIRYLIKMVGTVIMGIVYLFVGLFILPWWVVVIFLIFFPWCYNFFYDYLNLIRQ